jgi:hypothetical protein
MEKRSFPMIEERMSGAINKVTESILRNNLVIEEVRVTVEKTIGLNNRHFELWKQASNGTVILPTLNYPKLKVTFDMAWQQRSSGKKYASPSGHALFFGGYTRRPISVCNKSKLCNYCVTFKSRNPDIKVPLHDCLKNHKASSGSMEPQACLDMVVELHTKSFVSIVLICADNDSVTRSPLKWSNACRLHEEQQYNIDSKCSNNKRS